MARLEKPAAPDALAYSPEETETLLLDAQAEQRRLQTRQGQLEGRMEALGEEAALTRRTKDIVLAVTKRSGEPPEAYAARILATPGALLGEHAGLSKAWPGIVEGATVGMPK